MSKILINNTASPVTIVDVGNVIVPGSGSYTIPPQDYQLFAASSNTVSLVGAATIKVNDGSTDLSISDGIDLIKGIFPRLLVFNPTISNETISLANTEQSYAFNPLTKRFVLLNRGTDHVKLSYTSGQSGTTYLTIGPKVFYSEGLIGSGQVTLYFQSPTSGLVVEIVSWT